MSRYNHFAPQIYERLCFGELAIGDKFRIDKWEGKRRRKDIICIKTGNKSYQEFKSKKKFNLYSTALEVSHYSKILEL